MLNVDRIITLSLHHNTERQISSQVELKKLGIKSEFLLVNPDPENPERGCFTSHVMAAKWAQQKAAKNILIFEDDVKILPYSLPQITHANQFLAKKTDFDILYLGLIIGKMWYCGFKSIVGAQGAACHAYILSTQGIKKVAQLHFTGIPIDKIYKRQFKCYSLFPIIAEQYPETLLVSDISPKRVKNEIKDPGFWQRNYQKQQGLCRKHLLKTLGELMYRLRLKT